FPQIVDQQVGAGTGREAAEVGAAERIGARNGAGANQVTRGTNRRLAEMLLGEQARDSSLADEVHAVRVGADAGVDAGAGEARVRKADAFAREAERTIGNAGARIGQDLQLRIARAAR